ncbi:Vacuolar protein sorting-associated protein 52 A [Striga hermonthica]|uniref:Vacuolar protein sorting-associated protein 52 A n=1 Tax=Striga hermonthica TaxID=68872 RepID=A0A9N7NUL8_STRHE|nr:Vacuolar protein sorting-associated protein 52 A [Striga hermonthica]
MVLDLHLNSLRNASVRTMWEDDEVVTEGESKTYVKTRASEGPVSCTERAITVAEIEPVIKDFASGWKAAIEQTNNDVITSFSNILCGMEILRAALTHLLLCYTRLSDCMKRIGGGSGLNKMYEIKKYSRTL